MSVGRLREGVRNHGLADPSQGGNVVHSFPTRQALGAVRSRLNLNSPYLIVAEGLRQAETLLEAGVLAARIVALVQDEEEMRSLTSRGFPGDAVFTADRFATWTDARDQVWKIASQWLNPLGQVEVTFLQTTARTLPGLLAELQKLLPDSWQAQNAITPQTAEQLLGLYQLGV